MIFKSYISKPVINDVHNVSSCSSNSCCVTGSTLAAPSTPAGPAFIYRLTVKSQTGKQPVGVTSCAAYTSTSLRQSATTGECKIPIVLPGSFASMAVALGGMAAMFVRPQPIPHIQRVSADILGVLNP